MAADVTVTLCGNTTGPVDLAFGQSGAARCSFTLAVNSREKQPDGSWGDGPATFYRCTAWRQLGENIAATCGDAKSTRLLVHGRLRGREYEVQGQKRLSLDVDVEHVGPDLRFTVVQVGVAPRGQSGSSGQGWGKTPGQPEAADDPWGSPPPGQSSADETPPF